MIVRLDRSVKPRAARNVFVFEALIPLIVLRDY
jgi:hypothetical protein